MIGLNDNELSQNLKQIEEVSSVSQVDAIKNPLIKDIASKALKKKNNDPAGAKWEDFPCYQDDYWSDYQD